MPSIPSLSSQRSLLRARLPSALEKVPRASIASVPVPAPGSVSSLDNAGHNYECWWVYTPWVEVRHEQLEEVIVEAGQGVDVCPFLPDTQLLGGHTGVLPHAPCHSARPTRHSNDHSYPGWPLHLLLRPDQLNSLSSLTPRSAALPSFQLSTDASNSSLRCSAAAPAVRGRCSTPASTAQHQVLLLCTSKSLLQSSR